MASPEQFFGTGYPLASAAAGVQALADVASRLPRVEPAPLHAFASAVSSPDFAPRVEPADLRPALIAFASAVSPMTEPADFAPVQPTPDLHVSILPAGGEAMEAPARSRWGRFRPSAVTDRRLNRWAAWAQVLAFPVGLAALAVAVVALLLTR